MHATTNTSHHPTQVAAWPLRWGRQITIALAALLLLVALAVAGAYLIDEPLRRHMEAELNASMKGYRVQLPELDFHPLGFSLTLRGLTVRQKAHPEPPVMAIEALDAGVHWRALLHLRLVADFALTAPRLHINLAQLQHEAKVKTKLKDEGWQEALEAIYPLKINQFRVTDAQLTYVDTDPKEPLRITHANLLATNIRNVRSPDRTYPSPFHVEAVIFDHGRVTVDGNANFLAEPQPGLRGRVDLSNVPLQRLKPVTSHANVYVTGGTLGAAGDFEYAAKTQNAHLRQVTIDDLAVDYVHAPETALAEEQHVQKVAATAHEAADHPTAEVKIDDLTLRRLTVGYVDKTADPNYRVFLGNATIDVRDVSNQSNAGPAQVTVRGAFMGSGDTRLAASFLPRRDNPDLTLALQIEGTDLRAMNDLLLAYGNFDVVTGAFSLYTELQIGGGQIDGYIKPFFTDIAVYDRRQDRDKPVMNQIYQGLVGGVAGLLENRSSGDATEAKISGRAAAPKLSTWDVVINLVRNAFFKSILPGLDQSIRERAGSKSGK